MRRVEVARPRARAALRTIARPVAQAGARGRPRRAGLGPQRLARALSAIEPTLRRLLSRREDDGERRAEPADGDALGGETFDADALREAALEKQAGQAAAIQGAQEPDEPMSLLGYREASSAQAALVDEAKRGAAEAASADEAAGRAATLIEAGVVARAEAGRTPEEIAAFVRGQYDQIETLPIEARRLDDALIVALDRSVERIADPAIVERLLFEPRRDPDGTAVPAIAEKPSLAAAAEALQLRASAAQAERNAATAARSALRGVTARPPASVAADAQDARRRIEISEATPAAIAALLDGDGESVPAGPLRDAAISSLVGELAPDDAAEVLRAAEATAPGWSDLLRREGRRALQSAGPPGTATVEVARALLRVDPVLLDAHVGDPLISRYFDASERLGGDADAYRDVAQALTRARRPSAVDAIDAAETELALLSEAGPEWRRLTINRDAFDAATRASAMDWLDRGLGAGEAAALADAASTARAAPVLDYAVRRTAPEHAAALDGLGRRAAKALGHDPEAAEIAFLPTRRPRPGWAVARIGEDGAERIGDVLRLRGAFAPSTPIESTAAEASVRSSLAVEWRGDPLYGFDQGATT